MLVAFSVALSGPAPADGSVQSSTAQGSTAQGSSAAGSSAQSDSVHDAVAAAVRIVRESGLPNQTDSMFTTIEGEWDEVFAVIKKATEAVGEYGSRVSLVLKADIRPGHTGELTGKVERLNAALEK